MGALHNFGCGSCRYQAEVSGRITRETMERFAHEKDPERNPATRQNGRDRAKQWRTRHAIEQVAERLWRQIGHG